ncbi:putative F1F0 ATP synthase assembly protein Atp11, partial [Coniella lustricola]
ATSSTRTRTSNHQQRRWAQVHDVRFHATQPAVSRTVLEKYRAKLDAKAREEGYGTIDDLKKAYSDKIHEVRRKDGVSVPGLDALLAADEGVEQQQQATQGNSMPVDGQTQTQTTRQQRQAAKGSSSGSGVKPLSEILDLPKARTLPVPELTAIWRLRHASSPQSLCAVVPHHTYTAMEELARRHPQFVLPVPHPEQGAEIHFMQWTFDPSTATTSVLFTQLAEYKARGEFATPHTTVTHHLDLAADKKVVLMQGQVLPDRGVKAEDARWLVMCLQRFYGGWDGEGKEEERAEERKKLLEWFAKGDSRFSVEKLLEEAERF